ncbi:MAG: hypothetical protein V4662_17680 [Verrucomicrobiota bacterium]
MSRPLDPLANAQNDLFERIRHRRNISGNSISVQQMRPRTEEDATAITDGINKILSTLANAPEGPLSGLAIMLPLPAFSITQPNNPNLFGEIVFSVLVLENIMINGGSGGTGVTCELAAIEVMKAGHNTMIADNRALICDGMVPYEIQKEEYLADIAYEVTFRARAGFAQDAECRQPLIVVDGDDITVSCETAGASVSVTSDGTYPAPTNPNAFTVASGTPFDGSGLTGLTLRAVAYHPDLNPSLLASVSV